MIFLTSGLDSGGSSLAKPLKAEQVRPSPGEVNMGPTASSRHDTRAALLRDLRTVRTVRCVRSTRNPAAAGETVDINGEPTTLSVPRRASDVTYDASAGRFSFHRGSGTTDSITWEIVTRNAAS